MVFGSAVVQIPQDLVGLGAIFSMVDTRVEHDALGPVTLPADALYGAHTARALGNFPISGQPLPRAMIWALATIKAMAARVNRDLGLLDEKRADAIAWASARVAAGDYDVQCPVDIFQTGSGTSSNMNINEVVANLANQHLGAAIGSYSPVHPNDHVNLGQSSNDVFPTAIHIAAIEAIHRRLRPSLRSLTQELHAKAVAFDGILKSGRTHLQDATPMRLGQEFSGYAAQVEQGSRHLEAVLPHMHELALGGTAVGTGLNTHPEFGARMAAEISQITGHNFREAGNHFEAQSARDACVQLSGCLKGIAVILSKIANDIRWLASGPRLGLGELRLPAVQPGSSIMPGKVNPVIAEALLMACTQTIANDTAITLAGLNSNFQLNTMMPLVARNLLEQIDLLAASVLVFTQRLLCGLQADLTRLASMRELSPALATALVPHIGYDAAARLATRALETGKTIRQIATEQSLLPPDELTAVLDLYRQTEPGFPEPG